MHTRPSTQATTTGKARALNSPHTRRTQAHSASQRQHWRGQRRAHQHITKRAPGHKETRAPSADIAGGSELFVRSTSAPNDTPQTCLQTRAPSRHFGEGLSLATCAPVGGQRAAQCMAACPPPPRGAVRVRGGGVPRPSHHLPPGTSTAETSVPLTVQNLHLRLPVLNTFTLRPSEGESIQHRQRKMKMLGRERCTQLRKGGQRALSPIVASP